MKNRALNLPSSLITEAAGSWSGLISVNRAKQWYTRYGRWTLLLSWMPIIGDPLTIIAGVMRERLGVFIALVTIAKTGRYILIALLTKGALSL